MTTFHIVTIFPEAFESYLKTSVLGRAEKRGLIRIKFVNPRDFADDKHRTVDDKPYGGGAGMVFKPEPVLKAVSKIRSGIKSKKTKTVILSAKGKQFSQRMARNWAGNHKHIIIISGRYEGMDERVRIALRAEEISVGPYVLTDGDIAAMALVSSVSRLLPGVIKLESLEEESHFNAILDDEEEGGLEYPHYTRPEVIEYKGRKHRVPKVLLSGNHREIEAWRKAKTGKAKE